LDGREGGDDASLVTGVASSSEEERTRRFTLLVFTWLTPASRSSSDELIVRS
jgi:hypothetical protein